MEFAKVSVEVRSRTGKGGAHKVRAEGKVPGVLYGRKGEPVPVAAASPAPASGLAAKPRAVAGSVGHAAGHGVATAGHGVATAVRRDRTELIAAAVLALAILAGLTSWGALDLGGASSEAAPTVPGTSSD